MEKLLTEFEVSDNLEIAVQTLRNWRFNNRGPTYLKLGRSVRYKTSDLEEYKEAMTVRPGQVNHDDS